MDIKEMIDIFELKGMRDEILGVVETEKYFDRFEAYAAADPYIANSAKEEAETICEAESADFNQYMRLCAVQQVQQIPVGILAMICTETADCFNDGAMTPETMLICLAQILNDDNVREKLAKRIRWLADRKVTS